jgi:hypothetical protein
MSSEEPKSTEEAVEVSFADIPEAPEAPEEAALGPNTVLEGEAEANAEAQEESNVAPTQPAQLYDEFDINLFVQLGDTVRIKSKKYRNAGEIKGIVYYRSHERLLVKPFGLSMVYEFKFEENDEKEIYEEEYGVTEVNVIEKRVYGSFVEQRGFEVKQVIEAIDLESQDSEPVLYTILEVNRRKDLIIVKHEEDEPVTFEFNFVGIKPEEYFQILRIQDTGESEELEVEEGEVEDEVPKQVIEFIGSVEITLPERYREAEVFEQNISDSLQKVDAFNDFLMELSEKQQNDPRQLRKIRLLIEVLFYLKQSTVAYNEDGTKKGIRAVSVSSLTDLIDSVSVPLGRPVLNAKKKLYLMGTDERLKEDGNVYYDPSIFDVDFISELDAMNKGSAIQPISTGVREWSNKRKFLENYLSPWIPDDIDFEDSEYLWNAIKDADFFREIVPELDEDNVFEQDLTGYIASHLADEGPILDKIPFGVERALATIYRKGKEGKEVFIPEEKASVNAYLLFPLEAAPYIGATRCNLLALDSGSSQLPHKTMKMLLREYGSPVEGGTSKNIQLFSSSGETIGNIQLHHYIEGIYIISLNISDIFHTLQHYGIDNIELNILTFDAIIAKMSRHQKKFISTVAIMRNKLKAIGDPQPNPFMDLSFMEFINRETILKDEIENFKKFNPTLIESDVALMNHLFKKYSNYVQISAGKNNSLLLAKAKQDSVLTTYILNERIKQMIQQNPPHVKPIANKCKHVSALVTIRRNHDDIDRMKDLTAFYKKYQGARVDNWIQCNVCDQHLLCIHERLQIQGFLNPIEKASIDKEVILKFAGGQFQGKYICRTCGQQIREFDFDNNMEFDEQGRPKSGNAMVNDEDEELEEKLDAMISVPLEKAEYKLLELSSEAERTYYKVIRELCSFMRIDLKISQMKNILDSVIIHMQSKVKTAAQYAVLKAKRPDIIEYDEYYATHIIGTCAIYLLIEIQCAIPSLNIRAKINETVYTMTGYPLDTSVDNQESIDYMTHAVIACLKHEDPWNQAGIMEVPPAEQFEMVKSGIISGKLKTVLTNNVVQQNLHMKRRYMANKDLQKAVREILPISFLPEQIQETAEVIIPEVAAANNAKSRIALVNYWIRKAHFTALDTAIKIRGSTISETTCCTNNITEPGEIWSTDDFTAIDIGKRALKAKDITMLLTYYKERQHNTELIKPDEALYYRLFLKCCFSGPRIGQSHEPGLTYKCAWCGFQFPGNPHCIDSSTEGKGALAEIEMTNDTFYALLDKVHTLHIVASPEQPVVTGFSAVLENFVNTENPISDDWGELIAQAFTNYTALPSESTTEDELRALQMIAAAVRKHEIYIKTELQAKYALLKKICDLPWANFFDALQTYFVIYFQRITSGFSADSLKIPKELEISLSETHVDVDLTHIVKSDFGYAKKTEEGYKLLPDLLSLLDAEFRSFDRGKTKSKKEAVEAYQVRIVSVIKSFIEKLSELLRYKYTISFRQIRNPQLLMTYTKKLILYGSLAALLNKKNGRVVMELVMQQLDKFNAERLSLSPEEIKNMIAIRDEKERVHVVKDFDVLSDEEKQIEKVKKLLGIGKWAVGGTKLIYAYDADYYDLERQKRLDAGIIDFPGLGINDEPQGREVDDLGFAEHDGEDDGYDVNQHADDDYE